MIKKDDPLHHESDGIELTPSSSPQNASPVHVQFSPSAVEGKEKIVD